MCSKPKLWKIFACGGRPTGSRLKWWAASGSSLRRGINGQNFEKFKNHGQFSKNEIPDPPFPNFYNTSPCNMHTVQLYTILPPPPEIPVPTTGWQVCSLFILWSGTCVGLLVRRELGSYPEQILREPTPNLLFWTWCRFQYTLFDFRPDITVLTTRWYRQEVPFF